MLDKSFYELMERLVSALELIARTQAARFAREFPERGQAKDATVTHRQTDEERLRQEQGESSETDEEWIGKREKAVIADEASTATQGGSSTSTRSNRKRPGVRTQDH